jgi:hypothetical protein
MMDAALISLAVERSKENTTLTILKSEHERKWMSGPVMFIEKARPTLLDTASELYDQAFITSFTCEQKEPAVWESGRNTACVLRRVIRSD